MATLGVGGEVPPAVVAADAERTVITLVGGPVTFEFPAPCRDGRRVHHALH